MQVALCRTRQPPCQYSQTCHPNIKKPLHQWFVLYWQPIDHPIMGSGWKTSCNNTKHSPQIQDRSNKISIPSTQWPQIRLECIPNGPTRHTRCHLHQHGWTHIMVPQRDWHMVLRSIHWSLPKLHIICPRDSILPHLWVIWPLPTVLPNPRIHSNTTHKISVIGNDRILPAIKLTIPQEHNKNNWSIHYQPSEDHSPITEGGNLHHFRGWASTSEGEPNGSPNNNNNKSNRANNNKNKTAHSPPEDQEQHSWHSTAHHDTMQTDPPNATQIQATQPQHRGARHTRHIPQFKSNTKGTFPDHWRGDTVRPRQGCSQNDTCWPRPVSTAPIQKHAPKHHRSQHPRFSPQFQENPHGPLPHNFPGSHQPRHQQCIWGYQQSLAPWRLHHRKPNRQTNKHLRRWVRALLCSRCATCNWCNNHPVQEASKWSSKKWNLERTRFWERIWPHSTRWWQIRH